MELPVNKETRTMQAAHLPGIAIGEQPKFSFPNNPPAPIDLEVTSSIYPRPTFDESPSAQTRYIIHVHTTALTRGELTWREVLKPSNFHPYGGPIPGHDVVGTIDEIQPGESKIAKFETGDMVWGLLDFDHNGAAAQYAMAYEDELALAPTCPPYSIPEKWFQMLATIPLSGLTAFQALFIHGGLPKAGLESSGTQKHKQRVLVLGAGGSVCVLAVRLAKEAGFHVTAVCGRRRKTFVEDGLVPDHVLSSTANESVNIATEMREQSIAEVDVVIDCVGGNVLKDALLGDGCLRSGGKVVTIVAPLSAMEANTAEAIQRCCSQRSIEFQFFIVRPNSEQLDFLGSLVSGGRFKGYIDSVWPLKYGQAAMGQAEGTRAKGNGGKIVLDVNMSKDV